MEINISIGGRLKEVRDELKLSQTEFAQIAEKAGVPGATRQSQAKYEKGQASPSAAYLAAIAAAGADVLYVLTGERGAPRAETKGAHSALAGFTAEVVKQAVEDAVDLLALDEAVNAAQLAKAVLKLCGKPPVTGTAQVAAVHYEGSQQNFSGGSPSNIAGRDLVLNQPAKPRKK